MSDKTREEFEAWFASKIRRTDYGTLTPTCEEAWQVSSERYEPKWISVNDERPKLGQRVLLFSNGVVQENIFMYDEDDDGTFWSNELLGEFPTCKHSDYWMPLPATIQQVFRWQRLRHDREN